jgi:hypothetical protein
VLGFISIIALSGWLLGYSRKLCREFGEKSY